MCECVCIHVHLRLCTYKCTWLSEWMHLNMGAHGCVCNILASMPTHAIRDDCALQIARRCEHMRWYVLRQHKMIRIHTNANDK